MKIRTLQFVLVAALVGAVGTLALACGGSGGGGDDGGGVLTLDAYFQRLGELDQAFEQRTDDLDDRLNEELDGADSFDDTKDIFVVFFEEGVDAISGFVDDLERLDPPAEVEDAHKAALSAGRRTVDAFEGLLERVRDAESNVDFRTLDADTDFQEAGDAFDEACFDLQEVADENGIELNLDCEDLN